MRLKELQLLKYGPFDDQMLRFPGDAPGLHIIFGQNEAGKSSALRALKALLFGIGRSTRDDFLFGSELMSVGAVLQTAAGQEFEFQRWKKAPHLRDKAGKLLGDSSVLTRCLNGMDETAFERFYGLDYDELQRGSEMLLQEKGNVGTSIFSAGLGALDVRRVLTELDEKASDLFAPKARNRKLNAAIAEYNRLKSDIKSSSLTVKMFAEKDEEVREADGKIECLRLLQKELSARKSKLERIRRTRPMIAELNEFEMQDKDLGEVVSLPDGFIAERVALSEKLRKLRDEIDGRAREIAGVQEDIANLFIPESVLQHDATISDMQKRLELYSKARADLPNLKMKSTSAREEAEFILKNLRPGISLTDVESLRLRPDQIARIQALGGEEKTLRKTHDALETEARELEEEIRIGKEKLATLPFALPTERILTTITAIQKEGDLELKRVDEKKKLQRLRDESDTALKRLQFWNGSLEELAELKVPGADALADYEQRLLRKESERSTLATQIAGLERIVQECSEELTRLQESGGEIPTLAQLNAARERRERGWGLIRRAWISKEDVAKEAKGFIPPLGLPEAFEKSVRDADAVADNRFRDANRVSQHEDRTKRIEAAQRELAKLQTEKLACEAELERFQSAWRERWLPLHAEPGSIPEMRNWIAQRKDLGQRFEWIREQTRDCEALNALIGKCGAELSAALKEFETDAAFVTPGKSVTPLSLDSADAPEKATFSGVNGSSLNNLIEHARRFCKRQETRAQERKKLDDAIDSTVKNWRKKIALRDLAKTAVDKWQEKWAEAMGILALRPDAFVHEAELILAKTRDLFGKLDPIPETEKRVASIEIEIEKFERQTSELIETIDPTLARLHPDQATEALNARLIQARAAQATREQLLKQRADAESKNSRAEIEMNSLKMRMDELCAIAECGEPAELDAVERRYESHRVLSQKIVESKKAILNSGDGRGLGDLISEIADFPFDELDENLAQTVQELADLEQQYHAAHKVRAQLKFEFDTMDGKSSAADAAAQSQWILSQIRDEAEQYVRLRLAAEILKKQIDRYRDENQTPLLKHASSIFAKLTCGGFSGVRADLDEHGQNLLMGVRKNGHLLAVEGMSDGTRDQLYLALRLAFLPLYLEKEGNEPLPFVIDDVLINFDDTRCAAAFQFLAETSAKVQVIVFTHHKHIVDLATAALGGAPSRKEVSGTLEVYSYGTENAAVAAL